MIYQKTFGAIKINIRRALSIKSLGNFLNVVAIDNDGVEAEAFKASPGKKIRGLVTPELNSILIWTPAYLSLSCHMGKG